MRKKKSSALSRLQYRVGREAEEEICYSLKFIHGERNVSHDVRYIDGTNGHPDIKLKIDGNLFFVEVKSIIPFVKTTIKSGITLRTNSVKFNRLSYSRLVRNAKGKRACIVLIVNLRLSNKTLNFILDNDELLDFFSKSNALWVHIPLHYLLNYAKVTELERKDFIYKPVETRQVVLINE